MTHALRTDAPYRRESAREIAARIRNRIPARPLFISEAVQMPGDVVISSIGRAG